MGLPLVAARGGARGGVRRRGLGSVGVGGGSLGGVLVVRCRGGGQGGKVPGWHCWWRGGRGGGVFCWMGVCTSCQVFWAVCVRAVRV